MKPSLNYLACSVALALLTAVGCGKAESKVMGTITNGGQPLQVSSNGDIQVQFIQESGGQLTGQAYLASLDAAGHYEAAVPPGEYRVTVQQLDPYPNVDKLKGKFSAKNTPIKQTVKGTETLDIELSQYAK